MNKLTANILNALVFFVIAILGIALVAGITFMFVLLTGLCGGNEVAQMVMFGLFGVIGVLCAIGAIIVAKNSVYNYDCPFCGSKRNLFQ